MKHCSAQQATLAEREAALQQLVLYLTTPLLLAYCIYYKYRICCGELLSNREIAHC